MPGILRLRLHLPSPALLDFSPVNFCAHQREGAAAGCEPMSFHKLALGHVALPFDFLGLYAIIKPNAAALPASIAAKSSKRPSVFCRDRKV